MLPTPTASHLQDDIDLGVWRARRDRMTKLHSNGAGPPLGVVVRLLPTPNAAIVGSRIDTQLSGDGRERPNKLGWAIGSLLPTPTGRDGTSGPGRSASAEGSPDLRTAVTLLPTPRATDGTKGGPNQRGSSGDLMLPSAVQPERWGAYGAAVAHWENSTSRPAPSPTEPGKNGQPRLSPPFVEWLMGLPAGWVTDHLGRGPALKCLGNGVVWQQATHAYTELLGAA